MGKQEDDWQRKWKDIFFLFVLKKWKMCFWLSSLFIKYILKAFSFFFIALAFISDLSILCWNKLIALLLKFCKKISVYSPFYVRLHRRESFSMPLIVKLNNMSIISFFLYFWRYINFNVRLIHLGYLFSNMSLKEKSKWTSRQLSLGQVYARVKKSQTYLNRVPFPLESEMLT